MHHWGNSLRLGATESYGTVEDLLKECEMVVFWSSDPEATSGIYGAFEGTARRRWFKELGIELVHIDPFYNHTAALWGGKWLAPRPATGNALALAIAHVWITEGLYDKDYVAARTTGFDEWKDYILGQDDGVPKTPEWQEGESAVPAREVRALARAWGSKKNLSGGGGVHRLRQRRALRHRRGMGPVHGLPHGHAGVGQAGGEHGVFAAGRSGLTPAFIFRAMRKAGFQAIWNAPPPW